MNKLLTFYLWFCIVLLIASNTAFAQLDSLYTQQWNRDPITDLSSTVSAQRQIITDEQIRVSGYAQLSQVFQLIDGWTIKNLDDDPNHPQMQSNGASSYNHQNWVLMLNGQRIEMNRDYSIDVNQLGVSVVDVERIEIVNSTGMYLGEFTPYGLINIITKKNSKDGFGYRGFYANDINSTNYLKYGNNTSQQLSYKKGNFNISNSFGYLEDADWSPSVNQGLPRYGSTRTIEQYSNRLEVQYVGKRLSHQLSGLYSKKMGLYPTNNFYQAGYLGLFIINNKNQVRLSSTLNFGLMSSGLGYKQYSTTLQYRYLKNYKNGNLIWQNGVGLDKIETQHSFTNSSAENEFIIKPYTSINIPITRKINLFADAQASFCNNKIAPKVSVGIYKKVSLITNYSFVVGYNEMLWQENTLQLYGQMISTTSTPFSLNNSKLATADFYYNVNIGQSVKFSFNSGLKNGYNQPYNLFGDYYNYGFSPMPTDIVLSTYQFNWINRINFHYDIVKNLIMDINYMHTGILSTWNESLRNIPKHKFTLVTQYDFKKKLTLWSRNYVQSRIKWYDTHYDFATSEQYATGSIMYGFEIGLSKKILKDYLHLNITSRNLLVPDNRTPYRWGFDISMIANIDGIGEKKTTP